LIGIGGNIMADSSAQRWINDGRGRFIRIMPDPRVIRAHMAKIDAYLNEIASHPGCFDQSWVQVLQDSKTALWVTLWLVGME
jgi:hypothetical protein